MKLMARLLGLLGLGMVVAAVGGMIAAISARQRIEPLDHPEANDVRLAAFFGPLSFRSRAASFRGGTIDCWYGGGIIDLRDATLDATGARLEVRAIFGGGQIVVPDAWRVTTAVRGVGGVGDARPKIERAADAPHLTIEGLAVFGGFGVSSEVAEEAIAGLEEAIARRNGSRSGNGEPVVV